MFIESKKMRTICTNKKNWCDFQFNPSSFTLLSRYYVSHFAIAIADNSIIELKHDTCDVLNRIQTNINKMGTWIMHFRITIFPKFFIWFILFWILQNRTQFSSVINWLWIYLLRFIQNELSLLHCLSFSRETDAIYMQILLRVKRNKLIK